MKKITIATVKSFIKKNEGQLFVNVKSRFDGMTDCVEDRNEGFKPAQRDRQFHERTQGYNGINFTGSTKNWCSVYEDSNFIGYRVDNCCGDFVVAIRKGN